MILISGCFRFAPENRAAALAAALAMAVETRKEAGCITYGFFADVEDGNTFRIFEEWQSQAHLDAHFQTAHIASSVKPSAPWTPWSVMSAVMLLQRSASFSYLPRRKIRNTPDAVNTNSPSAKASASAKAVCSSWPVTQAVPSSQAPASTLPIRSQTMRTVTPRMPVPRETEVASRPSAKDDIMPPCRLPWTLQWRY